MRPAYRLEWLSLLREPTFGFALLALLLATVYAGVQGRAWREQWRAEVAGNVETFEGRLEKQKAELLAAAGGPLAEESRAGLGERIGLYAGLPPPPLATFAVGSTDLEPRGGPATFFGRRDTLFRWYQLSSPVALAAGRLDLAFVTVALLPLLIVAVAYNLLSSERERGTLGLALAQGISLSRFVRRKLRVRAALVAAVILVLLAGSAAVAGWPAPGRLLLWALLALLYGGFWLGVCLWVNLRGASSPANAATLATAWLAFVFLLPGAGHLAATWLAPVPSRLEYVREMREVSNTAQREGARVLALYFHEHPELAAAGRQDFAARYYAQQRSVEARLGPLLDRFDERVRSQEQIAAAARLLSPAWTVYEALLAVAGADPARSARFRREAADYQAKLQQAVLRSVYRQQRLAPSELDSLPRFTFREEPAPRLLLRCLPALAWLVALDVALFTAAWRRLRGAAMEPRRGELGTRRARRQAA